MRSNCELVRTRGRVTMYGPNDMALDNWGLVDRWISEEKISTYGPSRIGFVNFGTSRRRSNYARFGGCTARCGRQR